MSDFIKGRRKVQKLFFSIGEWKMTNSKIDFSDCKNEQQFKMKYIKTVIQPFCNEVFCIETEETVKGFPDVMCLKKREGACPVACFYEFKFANAQGKIKFQPSQPAFYKAHNSTMKVMIIAYNKRTNSVSEFTASCLFDNNSPYHLNEKAEVVLP